jgi:hypothetical protein
MMDGSSFHHHAEDNKNHTCKFQNVSLTKGTDRDTQPEQRRCFTTPNNTRRRYILRATGVRQSAVLRVTLAWSLVHRPQHQLSKIMTKESNDDSLRLEERKNESSPGPAAWTELEILQEGLPEEIQGKVFKDEGELWKVQEKIGLSDLQLVLNSEGYAVWREMPETEHNSGVWLIEDEFSKWKQEQGAVLYAN